MHISDRINSVEADINQRLNKKIVSLLLLDYPNNFPIINLDTGCTEEEHSKILMIVYQGKTYDYPVKEGESVNDFIGRVSEHLTGIRAFSDFFIIITLDHLM